MSVAKHRPRRQRSCLFSTKTSLTPAPCCCCSVPSQHLTASPSAPLARQSALQARTQHRLPESQTTKLLQQQATTAVHRSSKSSHGVHVKNSVHRSKIFPSKTMLWIFGQLHVRTTSPKPSWSISGASAVRSGSGDGAGSVPEPNPAIWLVTVAVRLNESSQRPPARASENDNTTGGYRVFSAASPVEPRCSSVAVVLSYGWTVCQVGRHFSLTHSRSCVLKWRQICRESSALRGALSFACIRCTRVVRCREQDRVVFVVAFDACC